MDWLKDSEVSSSRTVSSPGRPWGEGGPHFWLWTDQREPAESTSTSTLLLASVLSHSFVCSRNQRIGGQSVQT